MNAILNKRRAGILLHISSLPQKDLGADAYHFIDFLNNTGVSVWQTLPIGMTHADGSPYQCLSAHAGNIELVSSAWLVNQGWLTKEEECAQCDGKRLFNKSCLLEKALQGFLNKASQKQHDAFAQFCAQQAFWLDDFALFMVLRKEFNQQCWNQWPVGYKERDTTTLKAAKQHLKNALTAIQFEQYVFFTQWAELKNYANKKGILLFGDIPIFVSYDSADVWANRDVFKLNEHGEMSVVAGVPPDYFSEYGQRWGNPHYNWTYLKKTGFHWWIERLQTQMACFDILRIDHFRGLEAAWEIPASEPTAMNGHWQKAPGKALLNAIQQELGDIALVAEDLGIITDEVIALRDDFNLPGMKILQFAFGDNADNPYLPNNYIKNCVVYTGTHDNDTTVGWLNTLNEAQKKHIYDYLGNPNSSLHCALIQAALASVANLAIIPMQDILELDSAHRMNTPGTVVGNWAWQYQWQQLSAQRTARLAHLVELFNRR